MSRVKLCGLSRECDIRAVNEIKPDYIGFVFASKSRRYVSPEQAMKLKSLLDPAIKAVGVFVDEEPASIAALLTAGVIDMAQLHGQEGPAEIAALRALTDKPIIQAVLIESEEDVKRANASSADLVLLDGGKGQGRSFDWSLLAGMERPYFLAGGLGMDNVEDVVRRFRPYAVDISSGIETDGLKDREKMARFTELARKDETK